ncbi:MAG: trypsin-like peptidase domain-containing protein [Betaproteobacteria bacterium]|nr:MAG: trypsin-like peptidase domain-containing protein [Betaproteobacteria bacterium]
MSRAWACLALCWCAGGAVQAAPPRSSPPASAPAPTPAPSIVPSPLASPDGAASAPVSMSARRVYEQARSQLLQIRTVLKGRASQTSVGSGFIVSREGHIITNFHVVSEVALEPTTHDLVYVTADGREAKLDILMLDVLHDLALVKPADPSAKDSPKEFDALAFRPLKQALSQGERMYSLGNPLDVGFAVIEGNYNGLVERSFYPQIFFSGSLSAGMSGGPALDQEGRVIGVNVARRVDGEQVSFLVPGAFASALLEAGRKAPPMKGPAHGEITHQLMTHQAMLTDRFIAQGWKTATHPRYKVPVPPDRFMRCWGSTEQSKTGGLDFERSDCVMDTRVFVGAFTTGAFSVRHESYDGSKLGTLRFAARYSQSFRNESFGRLRSEHMTKPQCHEDFIDREGLPLRAVVCLRAYKKLPKLYDLAVLVATLEQNRSGVQGRFDAQGVSFANAMKLTEHYLDAYGRLKP